MGQLQESLNIKILEGMRINTYNMNHGKLVVSSSKKIKAANVSQADIDSALLVFHQDNMILNFCGKGI